MYQKYIKRILDFFIALVAFPVVLLLFLMIAPLIYFDDGFPIFYIAKRIGKNGKIFKMYKFRSMKKNSPDIRTESGDTYNAEDDLESPELEKYYEKTSIDEIPQLLNVLIGQMSLIGPRPDPIDWLDRYTNEEREFLKVRPGITGYNQAYFRNSVIAKEKIQNDIYYANNCNLGLDVKILIKTLVIVIKHENVYRN